MKSIIKLSGFLLLSTGTMGATIQELSDQCDGLRGELITAMNNVKLAERNHVAAEAGFEAAAAAASSAVSAYQFANDVSSLRRQMKSGRPNALRAFGKQNAGKHAGVCSGNADASTDIDCTGGSGHTCITKSGGTNAKCAVDMHEEQCNALDIGTCAAKTGTINGNCAAETERKECTDLGTGTCAVNTGDVNAGCTGKTTRGTCEDADIGTCAVEATAGDNWRCADQTTRGTCYTASIDTAGCIFTPVHECRFTPVVEDSGACTATALCTAVADGPAATCTSTMTTASGSVACTWTQTASDCKFTLTAANECVFTARDVRLNVNVGPGTAAGSGSVNAQQLTCCTDKVGASVDAFSFEIGDYKSSFERYEKIYDDLFKIKEDIKQQESSACGAYAAAAAALTA